MEQYDVKIIASNKWGEKVNGIFYAENSIIIYFSIRRIISKNSIVEIVVLWIISSFYYPFFSPVRIKL